MSDEKIRAELKVLNGDKVGYEEFVGMLARFASTYVMEIAKPIMDAATELYAHDAVVFLVRKWHEADTKYNRDRERYLVEWAGRNDEFGFDPYASYKWTDKERCAYRDALYAMLVR